MMYDIHCHILPGVDDGVSNIEEAMALAQAAENAGFKGIVCTPHYIDDVYKSSVKNNMEIINDLKKEVKHRKIEIELYLGNEVYISPDITNLLDLGLITTLNNSRYILIEMPIYSRPLYLDDIIGKLKLRGLVPVIAHPERYEWVMKSPKELSYILSKGCLVQLNMASILGYYGNSVKKTAKALLRESCIHLLGSDSHTSHRIYNNNKSEMKLIQRFSSDYKMRQFIQNTEAVINNQLIKSSL